MILIGKCAKRMPKEHRNWKKHALTFLDMEIQILNIQISPIVSWIDLEASKI